MRDDTSSTSSYARMLRQQYAFKHRDMSRSEGSGSSSSPAGPRAETRREGRDGIVCLDKDEYILFLEKEVLRNAAPPPAVVDADAWPLGLGEDDRQQEGEVVGFHLGLPK